MKYLLYLFLLILPVLARADSMITFAGGDGVSFTIAGPALAIVYGEKNNDYASWGYNIVNAATGAVVGNAGFGIGGDADSNRPITAVAYLATAGTYYVVGYSSQGGDTFHGATIPDDALSSQTAIATIDTAITDLQNQTDVNTAAIASLSALSTTLEDRVATLEINLNALQNSVQAGNADLQSQIDDINGQIAVLKQTAATTTQTLQSQIDSLSSRVTSLNSTSNKKLALNSYLLYGAAGLGAGALGVGTYALLNQPSSSVPTSTSKTLIHAK